MLAFRIQRGLQQIGIVDAGNFDRVLKAQKNALPGTIFRLECEQILPRIGDTATGYAVLIVAGNYLGKGTLAGTVRSHDGVDFTGRDRQRQAAQNFGFANRGAEIFDLQHAHCLAYGSFETDV